MRTTQIINHTQNLIIIFTILFNKNSNFKKHDLQHTTTIQQPKYQLHHLQFTQPIQFFYNPKNKTTTNILHYNTHTLPHTNLHINPHPHNKLNTTQNPNQIFLKTTYRFTHSTHHPHLNIQHTTHIINHIFNH